MGKRGGGGSRRRGLTRFKLKKPMRKNHHSTDGDEDPGQLQAVTLSAKNRQLIIRLAEWSFEFMTNGSYALGGIQFHVVTDKDSGVKKWVRGPLWHQLYHYTVATLLFLTLLHKFYVTIHRFREQESPDVQTLMCMSLFMIQFVGQTVGTCMVFRCDEAIEVMNSWKPFVAAVVDDEEEESQITPYDEIICSLKVINSEMVGFVCALANAGVSLLFPALPVCFYPICKAIGLLPDVDIPVFVWQLIFLPLEFVLGMIAMYNGGLAGMMVAGYVGVQRVCTRKLKEMPAWSVEERETLERRYIHLQLFHRSTGAWFDVCIPASIFCLSATVVVALFLSIRDFGLPWYLYVVFPTVGATLFLQLFGLAYDIIMVRLESEEIVDKLQLSRGGTLPGMGLAETRKALKRAQALSPLPFSIAGFANYTWEVPLAAWDEIVNQLFFLLSL